MWRTVELGDVLSLQNGYAFKSSEYEDDGYFVMRITNVQQGYISNHNPKYIKIDSSSKLAKFILNEGDILVSLTGDVGRVGVIKDEHLPAALNQRVARVTEVNPALVNVEFLFHYMNSDTFRTQVEKFAHGAAQANVSTKDILSISLALPPLEEQQRIVAKLDAAFAEIDRAIEVEQSQLKLFNQVREANLTEKFQALGDECRFLHLSEACTDFSRGKSKHRPRNDERLYGKIIPFVQTGDISNAPKYLSTYSKMYSDFGVQQSKRWNKGTVCITIAANIAELAILDIDACFPDSVIGAFPNSEITSSEYLFYLLNFFQKMIKGKSKGSAQQNINLATFSDEVFPFPALKVQQKIVSEISELETGVEEIIACKSKKIDALEALKSATLTQELQPSEAA